MTGTEYEWLSGSNDSYYYSGIYLKLVALASDLLPFLPLLSFTLSSLLDSRSETCLMSVGWVLSL